MRTLTRALCTLLLAPLLTLPASAQYTIDKVVFHNAAPYTEPELQAATGLEAGQFLTHDSLINAAHHLLDTGLFEDAEVTLSGSGKARTVVVNTKPIPLDKLLPASFENLVWLTPAELAKAIHTQLPLYRGVASDAGNFPDAIQSALQQILTTKGITATFSHAVIEPTTQHPIRIINFKVDEPLTRIATIHLSITGPPGVAAELAPLVKPALDKATNTDVNEGLGGFTLEDRLLTPARNAGYITAHLDNVTRTVAPSDNGISVTYTATLISGDPYKVSTITCEPTPLSSAADFTRDAKLHPGDLASISALYLTERPITTAYLLQGYMDVYVLSNPVTDTTAHTVAYTLRAVPGEIYRLHTVTVTGLSTDARKAFDTAWTMKVGDPYSDLAVNNFLRKNIAQPAFRPYSMTYQASADPQTHQVDLTLTFAPNPNAR
jgi:outer membrane protein assembly factor BamA